MSTDRPAAALHLVRHGEVDNPQHLVYASLSGFGLSEVGWSEAEATADHLAGFDVVTVVASPLQRAVETAAVIAAAHQVPVTTDDRLREWELGDRWAGNRWEDLPDQFPGELEAYLADPSDLAFSPEQLSDVAERAAAAVADVWSARPGPGDLVLVSHQDPVEALRRTLCGRPFDDFHADKPGHAAVVTLVVDGDAWREVATWAPPSRGAV